MVGPSSKIFILCTLATSSQYDMRSRTVYKLQREVKERYPLLHKHYRKGSYFDYAEDCSLLFKTLLSLELPSESISVMDEIAELVIKERVSLLKSLKPLRPFKSIEHEIVWKVIRDFTLSEAINLFQMDLKRYEINSRYSFEIDDEFNDILNISSDFLTISILDKIQHFINQGVPSTILKKLALSKMVVFIENAHLNLWKGSFGDLLLSYTSRGYIKFYDSYTLNYLEENIVAQDWIMLADLKDFSVRSIVLMFDFPERAEYIYKTPKNEVLRGIFKGGVTGWRQNFVDKVNWDQVKWTNEVRRQFQGDELLLQFKMDLIFDGFIYFYQYFDYVQPVFGGQCNYSIIKQDYNYNKLLNERQELVYLHLKDKGYPIQDIFITPSDELEHQIWEHFKIHAEDMDWLKFKALGIIHEKLSLSHSQVALGGEFLVEEYIKKCTSSEKSDLFFTLNTNLNEYFEEDIRIHFRRKCFCNDFSCARNILSSGDGWDCFFDEFKEAYLRKIDADQIYPKIIVKLKQDRDPIPRDLLFDVLEHVVFKKLGSVHKEIVRALRFNPHIFYGIEEGIQTQDWSDDIQDLEDNINQLYLLYHPQDILKNYSMSQIANIEEKVLKIAVIGPRAKISRDRSSSEGGSDFIKSNVSNSWSDSSLSSSSDIELSVGSQSFASDTTNLS